MSLKIVRNDIVNMKVDAIVNSANHKPVIGPGVDCAIHKMAGEKLIKARKKIGEIPVGNAVITSGFQLPSNFVIHTVGPMWIDGQHNEMDLLALCYSNSLSLAKQYGCKSIAFPLISTGNLGFPMSLALEIAEREISVFLEDNDMQIYLVVFGNHAFELSKQLIESVSSFIDENYIREKCEEEYGKENNTIHNRSIVQSEDPTLPPAKIQSERVPPEDTSLNDESRFDIDKIGKVLKEKSTSFSQYLLSRIDKTGMTDPQIYKKAQISRKVFSSIRSKPNYHPSKETALALAFALELSLHETEEFISMAGYALTRCSMFDVIVTYFLENGIYDIYELNEVLVLYGQKTLGNSVE